MGPDETFRWEIVLPAVPECGKEKVFMHPEVEKEYRPVGYKHNLTLSETQINCQGADCLFAFEFNISEAPLVSDSSICPIVDFKFMHIEEPIYVLTRESDQEVKIETNGKVARIEIHIDIVA
jgi:hypothetical protein